MRSVGALDLDLELVLAHALKTGDAKHAAVREPYCSNRPSSVSSKINAST
jgi:hypothetical protein